MAEFTRSQRKAFNDALLDAFRVSSFTRMLRFSLDKDIAHLSTASNFMDIVFEVITESEREGWHEDLVEAAHKANPGNHKLSAFYKGWHQVIDDVDVEGTIENLELAELNNLHILVIEDVEKWGKALKRLLETLGQNIHVDIATNHQTALQKIIDHAYDLITVDLSLPRVSAAIIEDDPQKGMDLLANLRRSSLNETCGLIILTGYPSTDRIRDSYKKYKVDCFFDKAAFGGRKFLQEAHAAILKS